MTNKNVPSDLKSTSYELLILLLSLLSLFNIALYLFPGVDPLIKGVISIMDYFITLIFMSDFLYRLFTVPSKSEYFLRGWGWADFLSSIPIQQFKIFRIFRVVKVARLLRHFGPRRILFEVKNNRAESALSLTVFLVIIVLEFGGGLIVAVEAANPDSNIKTAGDGVWWAFVTITTVGYGDRVPVTEYGRLVGMLTMMLGVGLYGVLTGFLTHRFVPTDVGETGKELAIGESSGQLGDIRQLLEEQERVTASLKATLDQIELTMSSEGRSELQI